jgi:hypothetical protein
MRRPVRQVEDLPRPGMGRAEDDGAVRWERLAVPDECPQAGGVQEADPRQVDDQPPGMPPATSASRWQKASAVAVSSSPRTVTVPCFHLSQSVRAGACSAATAGFSLQRRPRGLPGAKRCDRRARRHRGPAARLCYPAVGPALTRTPGPLAIRRCAGISRHCACDLTANASAAESLGILCIRLLSRGSRPCPSLAADRPPDRACALVRSPLRAWSGRPGRGALRPALSGCPLLDHRET